MKKILNNSLIVLSIISLGSCMAQSNEKIFGGPGYQIVSHCDVFSNGHYVFAGETSFNSWIKSDIEIYYTDPNLNQLWNRKIHGFNDESIVGLKVFDNKVYVFGNSNSEDGNLSSSLGGEDAFVYVLDNNGETLISKRYGGSGSDSIEGFASDGKGNFFLLIKSDSLNGDFIKQNNTNNYFVTKINSETEIEWSIQYTNNTYFYFRF